MLTPEAILMFMRRLDAEASESSPGGEWVFANGESVFQCTTSARRVAKEFGGRLVGFLGEDNPDAEIGKGENGHDFAIIAERFIVDYWGAHVVSVIDRAVFDLTDTADEAIVARLYGSKHTWRTVSLK